MLLCVLDACVFFFLPPFSFFLCVTSPLSLVTHIKNSEGFPLKEIPAQLFFNEMTSHLYIEFEFKNYICK